MNRTRSKQQSGADLVDQFWKLQNHEDFPEANDSTAALLANPTEIEQSVVGEELSRGREQVGSTEYGRFLAMYYSLIRIPA